MFKLMFTSLLFLSPVPLFTGLQTFSTGGEFPFKSFGIAKYERNFVGMGP
jgi:hypothetical protein